jgi:hypothetical protein
MQELPRFLRRSSAESRMHFFEALSSPRSLIQRSHGPPVASLNTHYRINGRERRKAQQFAFLRSLHIGDSPCAFAGSALVFWNSGMIRRNEEGEYISPETPVTTMVDMDEKFLISRSVCVLYVGSSIIALLLLNSFPSIHCLIFI